MKKSGKASVLSRQKPRRSGRATFFSKNFLKLFLRSASVVLGILLLGGVFYEVRKQNWQLFSKPTEKKIPWKVELKLDGEHPLTDRKTEEIQRLSKELLKVGNRAELSDLVVSIQRLDAFGLVHAIRVAGDKVVISLKPRSPIMCAEIDRLRLVADTGEIYGVAGVEGAPSCPGPRLLGILGNNEKIEISPTQTVTLPADAKAAVIEAIELSREADSKGLKLATIEFRKHRGFIVYIEGIETEVALGRAPFLHKLDKLRMLLGKLASRGEVAMRIELDYQGKAFVKLKKL